jgi:hypothetical protein
MNTYDLLVIGSDPAGQRAAISGVKRETGWRLRKPGVWWVVSARTLALFQVKLSAKQSPSLWIYVSLDLWAELSREGQVTMSDPTLREQLARDVLHRLELRKAIEPRFPSMPTEWHLAN